MSFVLHEKILGPSLSFNSCNHIRTCCALINFKNVNNLASMLIKGGPKKPNGSDFVFPIS